MGYERDERGLPLRFYPEPEESPVACQGCGETRPDRALDSDGLCQSCCFKRYVEARRRREEYERLVDGGYEISDADPGL